MEEWHDSAAALVLDGRVVAAIEQERLDRVKHSNVFPADAINHCLKSLGVSLSDVDRIAIATARPAFDLQARRNGHTPADLLRRYFMNYTASDRKRFAFVPHHHAHAMTAFIHSGMRSALVVTVDGGAMLENEHGRVYETTGRKLRLSRVLGENQSIGRLYYYITRLLGFSRFDEYKVMGLAPYGEGRRFKKRLAKTYELLPEGSYRVDFSKVALLGRLQLPVLRRDDEPSEAHKDLAAGLQEAIEEIMLHVLKHYRTTTGQDNLAMAGGVALNCSMNGRIVQSGLFRDVFVHPASHDGGLALGAALATSRSSAEPSRLTSVYWGSRIENNSRVGTTLSRWSTFVRVRRVERLESTVASRLAAGEIVGWVQGRSEFGPRALGNRSILADPRPAANKERINSIVKKREAFRPFAPAVIEERVRDFFIVPDGTLLPFMTIVCKVRPEWRRILQAVTHVDSTARLQTVSKADNPKFWRLLFEFGERTGVPVLLNTSFNNNAEPIVDSVDDALSCFLTTGLETLVVADWCVEKLRLTDRSIQLLIPDLANNVVLLQKTFERGTIQELIRVTPSMTRRVSNDAYEILKESNGLRTIRSLKGKGRRLSRQTIDELLALWEERWIVMRPTPA